MSLPGIPVWANRANGTLAGAITNSQTTITLNSGQGALFPNPGPGQFFPVVLQNASNPTLYEIAYCTSISTDTLTVVRGQEGTSGQAFNSGDIVANEPTAATFPASGGTGQIMLSYVSTTSIIASPYGGNTIRINGSGYPIPAAGITAANTGVYVNGVAAQNLAASTSYYVAISYISSTLTLGFFACGGVYSHAPDTTGINAGTEVITDSGSPLSSWSLIGMAATNPSSQFQANSGSVIAVLNWFNQREITAQNGVTAQTSTSTTGAEFADTPRVSFITWAGKLVKAFGIGDASNSVGGNSVAFYIGFDVTTGTPANSGNGQSYTANATIPVQAYNYSSSLTEVVAGHFATLLGYVQNGGTGTYTLTYNVTVSG